MRCARRCVESLARALQALLLVSALPSGVASASAGPLVTVASSLPSAAGVAPDQPFLFFLDRSEELFARTLFTLGLPSLRLHTLLQQAFERLAELALLERRGTLTVALAEGLVRDLRAIFADAVPAATRAGLVATLAARQVAASELLEAFAEEVETAVRLGGSPAGDSSEDLQAIQRETFALASFLAEVARLPPSAATSEVTKLALAAAERSLLRVGLSAEEQAAEGRLVLAADALRARAASFLEEGRIRLDAGDAAGALDSVAAGRRAVARLRDPALVFEPSTLRVPAERARAAAVLGALEASGVLTTEDAAGVRAALPPAGAPRSSRPTHRAMLSALSL